MPKSKVNDPITDQEIVYARLILSGKMSDQEGRRSCRPESHHRRLHQGQTPRPGMDAGTPRRHRQGTARTRSRAIAPQKRHPRTSARPPLGHRRPQLRRNQGKRHQPDQGPGHDRSPRRTDPRPSRPLRGKIRPAHARAQMYQAAWLRKQSANTQSGPLDDQESEPPNSQPESTPEPPEPSITPSPAHNQPTHNQEATTVPPIA